MYNVEPECNTFRLKLFGVLTIDVIPLYIGWGRNHRDGHHVLLSANTIVNTGCESTETTACKRRVRFADFMVGVGNELHSGVLWRLGRGRGGAGLDGLILKRCIVV